MQISFHRTDLRGLATSLGWSLAVLLEAHAKMGKPKPPTEALQLDGCSVHISSTCGVLQQLQTLPEFGILGGGSTCITGKKSR